MIDQSGAIQRLLSQMNTVNRNKLIAFVAVLFLVGLAALAISTSQSDELATSDTTVETQQTPEDDAPSDLSGLPATTLPKNPETTAGSETHSHSGPINDADLEPFRNTNPNFSQFFDVPESQINISALTTNGSSDNGAGPGGEAQFRARCHFSHLAYDDPIVHPGQPGASHLHMFYGNTGVDAFTTDESLVNTGGGSCQGAELNRTGYWMPALFDGDKNVRVPKNIDMYYKTRNAGEVVKYPQGLKMIAGTANSRKVGWACYDGTGGLSVQPQIPDRCGNGTLAMAVYFPECWDGRLDSDDHMSHLYATDGQSPCPASHPQRLVEYSLHVYWDVAGLDLSTWEISSDKEMGGSRGSSVHADWYGGWNEAIQDTWFNNCIKAVRGCSLGQTGTPQQLSVRAPGVQYPNGVGDGQYSGPKVIDIGL